MIGDFPIQYSIYTQVVPYTTYAESNFELGKPVVYGLRSLLANPITMLAVYNYMMVLLILMAVVITSSIIIDIRPQPDKSSLFYNKLKALTCYYYKPKKCSENSCTCTSSHAAHLGLNVSAWCLPQKILPSL